MNTVPESNKSSQEKTIYDVVIAGAGPVGLFLACELALAKCSVLILEKAEKVHSPLKQLPFGMRGLSAPSIEAFYRRGLLDELQLHKRVKNPHVVATGSPRQVGHFAGIPLFEQNIDTPRWTCRLPDSTPTSLLSEMEEVETALTRRALSLGVEILRGNAITNFHQSPGEVTVQSNDQLFHGHWLVGCDGSRSVVRKLGGFDFVGTEPEFTGYSAQVDIADPEKLGTGRNVTPRGMYLQSQPGYVIIQDFDAGAFHHSKKPITAQHLQDVLRRISNTDVTITAVQVATTWTDRARQATSYRNGRVLLAGDAAHIHSPLGGQGLNLGLGDAMNLGWKLASTIKGMAPSGLLDSYESERHPIGAQVLDWSRAQVAIMKPDPQSQAVNAIFRELINTRDGATLVAARVWGIFMHYDLGGNHPLIGHSVPNFTFEDGSTIGDLMHDGKGLLLDLENDTLLRYLADDFGDQIKYISAKVRDRLGLNALLVRRDGIIAWVSTNKPDTSELRSSADRWFVASASDAN